MLLSLKFEKEREERKYIETPLIFLLPSFRKELKTMLNHIRTSFEEYNNVLSPNSETSGIVVSNILIGKEK